MRRDRCAWKRCRQADIELVYLEKPLCRKHWFLFCEMQDEGREDEAREKIGLRPRGASGAPQRNE